MTTLRGIVALLTACLLTMGLAVPEATAQARKLQVAIPVAALSFGPVYVAKDKGFFAAEGLDAQLTVMESGPVATQALAGGQMDVIVTGASDVLVGHAKGVPLIAVQTVTRQTMEIVARRGFVQERRLSPETPLAQRLAALKGARFGITKPGAITDTVARWLLKKAGYDPIRDAEIVSVGGAASQMAGLRQNKVDLIIISPPIGPQVEHEGYGVVLIPPTDIPEFNEFVLNAALIRRETAERQPELAARTVRALGRGINLMLDQPEEARRMLALEFPKIHPAVLGVSVDRIRKRLVRDGRMVEAEWRNLMNLSLEAELLKRPLDTREGGFWTNRFIQ